LINASFYYWAGGASTGPRYLTPALGFLALPFGLFWAESSPRMKWLIGTLFAVSLALSLMCAAIAMDAPQEVRFPLFEYIIPRFLAGESRTIPSYLFDLDPHIAIAIYLAVAGLVAALLWRWTDEGKGNPPTFGSRYAQGARPAATAR
jgi:hypothetical protein